MSWCCQAIAPVALRHVKEAKMSEFNRVGLAFVSSASLFALVIALF